MSNLEAENAELRRDKEKLQEWVDVCREDLANLRTEFDDLKTLHESTCTQADEENAELRRQLQEMRGERDDAQVGWGLAVAQREEAEEEVAELRRRIAEHVITICNYQEEFRDGNTEVAELRRQLEAADARDVEWQTYVDAESKRLKETRERVVEASGYLGRLLLAIHPQIQLLPDLIGRCTQIDNAFTGEKEAREKLAAFVSEHTDTINKERDELRRQLTEVNAALHVCHVTAEGLRQRLERAEAALREIQSNGPGELNSHRAYQLAKRYFEGVKPNGTQQAGTD